MKKINDDNRDLEDFLKKWLILVIGCVVIAIVCNYPLISSIIFGFSWCSYVLKHYNK